MMIGGKLKWLLKIKFSMKTIQYSRPEIKSVLSTGIFAILRDLQLKDCVSKVVNGVVLWEKLFLKIPQDSQKNTCARV